MFVICQGCLMDGIFCGLHVYYKLMFRLLMCVCLHVHVSKLFWLNGWVCIYDLSGFGFKSHSSHLNSTYMLRFGTIFTKSPLKTFAAFFSARGSFSSLPVELLLINLILFGKRGFTVVQNFLFSFIFFLIQILIILLFSFFIKITIMESHRYSFDCCLWFLSLFSFSEIDFWASSVRANSQIENSVLNVDPTFGERWYIVATTRFHV